MKPIHPFPARMAPSLVLDKLALIDANSRVLDPMTGSGVVLRQAVDLGHEAIGFDLDPLAVLMSQVWTTSVSDQCLEKWSKWVNAEARAIDPSSVELDWMDSDSETNAFVIYWFAESQRSDLRRIAYVLNKFSFGDNAEDAGALNLLRLALSRIIITKEPCASLARDTSHSRPHKVCKTSNFEIFPAFERSVRFLRTRLTDHPPKADAKVKLGDARRLDTVDNETIDIVITSPPYLNAIDYLRGHRLALVWLGHSLGELRKIRSGSIGAERGPDERNNVRLFSRIKRAMVNSEYLPDRYSLMIERYAADLYQMISEVARILRPGGTSTFVVGNNYLKGTFVNNAAGIAKAAQMVGLAPLSSVERTLPDNKRYLPLTTKGKLARRMRTETVCSFIR